MRTHTARTFILAVVLVLAGCGQDSPTAAPIPIEGTFQGLLEGLDSEFTWTEATVTLELASDGDDLTGTFSIVGRVWSDLTEFSDSISVAGQLVGSRRGVSLRNDSCPGQQIDLSASYSEDRDNFYVEGLWNIVDESCGQLTSFRNWALLDRTATG